MHNLVVSGDQMPNLALLRVCKSVATDAKKIFFGKNTWLLNQETVDLPMKPFWKQLLEQPNQPPLGHLYVFFDDFELDPREALKLRAPPPKPAYNLRPTRSTAPSAEEPPVTPGERKLFVGEVFSWKIGVIRALLDKKLIAKGLSMNFQFCEWFDIIVENPRWFQDDMKTRSGRRIRTHASTKARNNFPGPNVKFEPQYNGLSRDRNIQLFKDHGFRGQFV
ncbi:MAG: hypothetical protein Q9212_006920 [Teloschistes hypoglaucus]